MRAQEFLPEVNYPDELTVSDRIQQYFFQRGYELAGEGRDQMAFESPRGTIVMCWAPVMQNVNKLC